MVPLIKRFGLGLEVMGIVTAIERSWHIGSHDAGGLLKYAERGM